MNQKKNPQIQSHSGSQTVSVLSRRRLGIANFLLGHQAEKTVAEYLTRNGYKILEMNWKVQSAEIDIVAKKDGSICFVEVKARTSLRQGDGFEYITNKKIKRMCHAALVWTTINDYEGEYNLAAASVLANKEIKFRAVVL